MCECRNDFEARAKDKYAADNPTATDVCADLNGYVYTFGPPPVWRAALPLSVRMTIPKAKGGTRQVKKHANAIATYCPFCGVKYDG
jgi:hypothetical protein